MSANHPDQCDVCGRFAFESCGKRPKVCPRNVTAPVAQAIPVPIEPVQQMQAVTAPAAAMPKAMAFQMAKAKGYTGDMCSECSNFTMVRNGTCLKCDSCGGTSGCS